MLVHVHQNPQLCVKVAKNVLNIVTYVQFTHDNTLFSTFLMSLLYFSPV